MTPIEPRTERVLAALRDLVPSDVHVAVGALADADLGDLTTTELALISRATIGRQREFAAGRRSARLALAQLGHPEWSIERGARGEPVWPHSVVGSISHAGGVAAAAVARQSATLISLGIDVELADSLDPSMWSSVLLPEERTACQRSGAPTVRATVAFSAKEAMIKAHYPPTGVALDFLDIRLRIEPTLGAEDFSAWHVEVGEVPHRVTSRIGVVRCRVIEDLTVSVAVVP